MELMEQLRNGSFKRSDILKIICQVGGDLIQYTDFWFNSLSSSSSCFSWPPHDVAGTVLGNIRTPRIKGNTAVFENLSV